jgi:hypothetical protein
MNKNGCSCKSYTSSWHLWDIPDVGLFQMDVFSLSINHALWSASIVLTKLVANGA